jgi:hypothetical protein
MSDDRPPPPPSVFQRLRSPAALNYLIMTGAGLMVYGMIMVGMGNDIGAIVAILLAIPGVLARWTAAPVLVLLLTIYLMVDPGFMWFVSFMSRSPWILPREPDSFSLNDLLLATGLLAYAIGHFRLTSIIHQSMPEDPTVRRDRDPVRPPRRPAEVVAPEELPRTLMVAGGCVVVGQAAWLLIVLMERFGRSNTSVFTVGTSRFMLVAWIVGLAIMIVSAALIYMRSARMTRAEAALSLRNEFFQENRRETDRLLRWRKWYKERLAFRRRSGK